MYNERAGLVHHKCEKFICCLIYKCCYHQWASYQATLVFFQGVNKHCSGSYCMFFISSLLALLQANIWHMQKMLTSLFIMVKVVHKRLQVWVWLTLKHVCYDWISNIGHLDTHSSFTNQSSVNCGVGWHAKPTVHRLKIKTNKSPILLFWVNEWGSYCNTFSTSSICYVIIELKIIIYLIS